MVERAIEQNPLALSHASKRLCQDRSLALKAVTSNAEALQCSSVPAPSGLPAASDPVRDLQARGAGEAQGKVESPLGEKITESTRAAMDV
mmetsp:Transcript_45938/g.127815  ORF Transcript_45938/g.127815 Transcript_45938/m.127815 type:complete len:90 (+) Transcript_45938:295-564(+)